VTAEEKPKVRISRLTVDRGESKSNSGEVWKRCFYGIEFEFSSEATAKDFEDAHQAADAKIIEWLKEKVAEKPATPSWRVDPAQLEKLPWKPYKEGHRAAWIFSNVPEAQPLAQAIRESPEQKIEVGEFQYRFSGPKEDPLLFISRNPTVTKPKEEGASPQ
jgi:hypothetical protein